MAYVLGYIVADGCILFDKTRKKHPYSLNITSAEKDSLERIRKALSSEHKIGKKSGGNSNIAYQLQIRNPVLTQDLMDLGVFPRKTYNLEPIKVRRKYFRDFARGFFDGDGSVYIYVVNGVPQIKAGFVCSSLSFLTDFNRRLCRFLPIPVKTIHSALPKRENASMLKHYTQFYIDDCEKLAQFMYGHNPNLYLPRKRQIFEKWQSIERRHYIKRNYPSKIGWHLNAKLYI